MIKKELLEKYFSPDDVVEVSHGIITKGIIIEISDDVLVLKIAGGNPCLISLSTIDDCKLVKSDVNSNISKLDNSQIDRVKTLVKNLVLSEDKTNPISDKKIVAKIKAELGFSANKPFVKEIRSLLDIPTRLERQISKHNKKEQVELNNKDNFTIIPASAEIYKYFKQHKNGAAKNEQYPEIRFTSDVVVDEELLNIIEHTNYWSGEVLPIICSYTINKGKTYANFIVQQCSLESFRKTIISLRNKDKNDLADSMEKFLEEYYGVDTSNILIEQKNYYKRIHQDAQKSRLIKDFSKAEELYKKLITENYELDSIVKDLATMYAQQGRTQEAVSLMEEFMEKFENKVKAYNVLYTLCGTKDINKAIKIIETLLDLNKHNEKTTIRLLKKKENLLKKIGLKTKQKQVSLKKHIEGSVLSKSILVLDDIVNCEDKEIFMLDNKSFGDKVNAINQMIADNENSIELHKYHLIRLKLYSTGSLNEEISDNRLKEAMVGYCRANARRFIKDGNFDSAREYLMECIDCADDLQSYILYLFSFCVKEQYVKLINSIGTINLDVFFDEIQLVQSTELLRAIAVLTNKKTQNSRSLVKYIYNYCKDWIAKDLEEDIDRPQDFIEFLKDQYEDEKEIYESIQSLLTATITDELQKKIAHIDEIRSEFLSEIDKYCLIKVREIINLHLDFEKKNSFDDKKDLSIKIEQNCKICLDLLEQKPSKIGRRFFKPIIEQEIALIESSMNKLRKERKPIILLSSSGEAINDDDVYKLQVDISNGELCSKVSDAKLYISTINEISLEESIEYILPEPIYGGNHQICLISIKSKYVNNSVTQITIGCSLEYFDDGGDKHSTISEISFDIHANYIFESFPNPFAAADIVEDDNMFKGRDNLIQEICERMSVPRRGYVLYGQKRSGKSSVLWHVSEQLKKERNLFSVYFTMGSIITDEEQDEDVTRADLYYEVLKSIELGIKQIDRKKFREQIGNKTLRRIDLEEHPEQDFRFYLDIYRDFIKNELGFKKDHIVLAIDEITKMYYLILEQKVSPQIMSFWKSLIGEGYFSIVWAGQDSMPRFIAEYANDFGVFNPQPLSYLEEKYAKELIEMPIWNHITNESRFDKDAVNEIIRITACSPYYIQHICSDVVSHANNVSRRLPITVYDVQKVVEKDMEGKGTFTIKDFDNLVSCGDAKLDIVPKEQTYSVLRDIALYTRNHSWYVDVKDLPGYLNNKDIQEIVRELLRREVLISRPNVTDRLEVKIKVELFKKWIINHECY